eukprot:Gregarina_sp_Poly_1__1239@NODE_1300_length_4434_cov_162_872910_g880_i0_p4_GENE_NODE_1300_length_4434_cov_162_872910_g880_i0NODE_1300_length_4434_cov_162_872910_g880_i0_p4_ORF_typecomplete_len136_score11_90_NODE_1300_length_4434_cov_162_872910_g880_i021822589
MVQIWASVGLASSLVLHCFAGMSNFPVPPRLSHIITDSHNGEPVTFDATNRELLTNLVTAAQLVSPIDTKPSGYCVLGATVPTRGSPGNALVNGAHLLLKVSTIGASLESTVLLLDAALQLRPCLGRAGLSMAST